MEEGSTPPECHSIMIEGGHEKIMAQELNYVREIKTMKERMTVMTGGGTFVKRWRETLFLFNSTISMFSMKRSNVIHEFFHYMGSPSLELPSKQLSLYAASAIDTEKDGQKRIGRTEREGEWGGKTC